MPYQITLPKPCNEKWSEMSPTERGRFCSSCQKQVTDYTNLTDRQLHLRLKSKSLGCGRFRKDQLNRAISSGKSKRTGWTLAAVLAALAGGVTPVVAQQKPEVEQVEVAARSSSGAFNPYVLRGKVVDSHSNEPLPGAAVVLTDTDIEVKTNIDGNFSLNIPYSFLKKKQQLEMVIQYVGFADEIICVSRASLTDSLHLNVRLEAEFYELGGPMFTSNKKRFAPFRWFRNLFRKKH